MFVIVLLRNVNYGRSENSESQVTRRILKQKKKGSECYIKEKIWKHVAG